VKFGEGLNIVLVLTDLTAVLLNLSLKRLGLQHAHISKAAEIESYLGDLTHGRFPTLVIVDPDLFKPGELAALQQGFSSPRYVCLSSDEEDGVIRRHEWSGDAFYEMSVIQDPVDLDRMMRREIQESLRARK
jgi:hypothetical protein